MKLLRHVIARPAPKPPSNHSRARRLKSPAARSNAEGSMEAVNLMPKSIFWAASEMSPRNRRAAVGGVGESAAGRRASFLLRRLLN